MSHRSHGGATRGLLAAAGMGLLIAWILPSCLSIAQGQTKDETTGLAAQAGPSMDPALASEWMRRWKQNILGETRDRTCDREMGEQIGDLVGWPLLNGFYYGYMATGDRMWVDHLIDWADSVIKRGVKGPDGYVGWPKADGAEAPTDSEMGEAMFFRPVVMMAGEILKTPALKKEYGAKAEEYLRLSEKMFEKWDSRGAWHETKEGGLWVVPPFGVDPKTGKWTAGYERRNTDGFSLPDNKENFVALWLIAMYDVTHKPIYRERAEKWWRVQKSRMKLRENGKYFVWDYWDPAGPWDYKADGTTRHWVGVHPNGGYYSIDVDGIVAAYEHGLVFTKEDIARLIATNRDFMWNQQIKNAKFQRIDGEKADPRWAKTPGMLWVALAPYDPTLRKVFEANHEPASWGGLNITPQWLARFGRKAEAGR
ncbi:MAG: hypothetical protein ABSA67_02380 [Candidatus Brocadiia bacterium]|jgi:hypothetical protein